MGRESVGGTSPLASPEPRVLYFGAEAPAVAAAWNDAERPFVLEPAPPEEAVDTFRSTHVDCVVSHSDGDSGAGEFIEAVREASESVPIIVLATDGGVSSGDAMAVGATYVDLDPGFDRIGQLEEVAPIVDRYRDRVRDRTMLDSLLEHIPVSIYWKDRQSRHVKVSDAMLSMIGPDHIENPEGKRFHTPEDVRGNTDWDIYPKELAESAIEDDRQVMESGEPIYERVEHSYGSRWEGTYVATSKAPWYDEQGRMVGLVGITRDISERMQYEHQLERQNERLERFAEVISHDLRNPLEVARGRLALARESGDAEEHFGPMERALERMDQLIDDVLTLAREGEVVADPKALDLATAAESAWELVESSDATLAVESNVEILADPGRLQQVFENLFRNSIEHGHGDPDGEGSVGDGSTEGAANGEDDEAPITVTVGELEHSGFYVEDDGVGIPADVREEIFEPGFSDGDASTGLGLGIVRTIAEAHGWTVEATESEAGGARFEFTDVRRAN